jgi:hypothetical protein
MLRKIYKSNSLVVSTVNSTSDYTLWTLYRSYFKGISPNIELHVNRTTHHSRFIPERVKKASQIFLRDAHVLPKYKAM